MRKPFTIAFFILSLGASLLTGCGALRPATVPIRSVVIHDAGETKCLAVILPGRYAAPETFAPFAGAVAARGIPLDVVAVDAHLGYYRTRTVLARVREDVILPARANGYDEVWLAGASLGGLGTLLYLRDHAEDLSGVLAIAPFLGEDEVIDEIIAAGGPQKWRPPATIAGDDIGRNIWSFLTSEEFLRSKVPVSLGWGTGDEFDRSNGLLASLLPTERTFANPGGHDMKTWSEIWARFLDAERPCR